jgi:hypothetical protein
VQEPMSAMGLKRAFQYDWHVRTGCGVAILESCSSQAFKKLTLLLCRGVSAENFVAVIDIFRAKIWAGQGDRHVLQYATSTVGHTKEPLFDQSVHPPLQSREMSNRYIPY